MLKVDKQVQVPSEWFLYQQEVGTCNVTIYTPVDLFVLLSPPGPPTPTDVTAQLMNSSSVKLTWQWTSLGSAPNCFNTTRVIYHPEGGGDSSLELSDPAATEATLTGLQCNTNYTITVVATAGEQRRESVAMTVYLPVQGIATPAYVSVYLVSIIIFPRHTCSS